MNQECEESVLDESSLKLRTENLKQFGVDVQQEEIALAELQAITTTSPRPVDYDRE